MDSELFWRCFYSTSAKCSHLLSGASNNKKQKPYTAAISGPNLISQNLTTLCERTVEKEYSEELPNDCRALLVNFSIEKKNSSCHEAAELH